VTRRMAASRQEGGDDNQFFRPINADDPGTETTEVESLCVSCGDNVSIGCSTFFKT